MQIFMTLAKKPSADTSQCPVTVKAPRDNDGVQETDFDFVTRNNQKCNRATRTWRWLK